MKSVSRLSYHRKPPSVHLSCGLLESCYPAGSLLGGTQERGALACTRTQIKRGKHLYESGDPMRSIYSIIAGTFKTCTVTERGEEQVLGFYMRGAIMGLDAMATGHYAASAIAIEDSQVCMVTAECLEQHCQQDTSVARRVHAAMAREINAQQSMILMLGRKTAEERVASFLIRLAATYAALGYSASDMNLVMTREEIGSYLGLTLETVSRILSGLQDRELLTVNQKHIRLLDVAELERLGG
jgi:CRP/FNR family transcriptional regulator